MDNRLEYISNYLNSLGNNGVIDYLIDYCSTEENRTIIENIFKIKHLRENTENNKNTTKKIRRSQQQIKRKVKKIPMDVNNIEYVISDPILSRSLMEFLKKNYCEENLHFLKKLHNLIDPTLDDILFIFNHFIKPGSPEELNLNSNTIKSITNTIEQLKNEYNMTVAQSIFLNAQNHVLSLLELGTFQNYLNSSLFKESKTLFYKINGISSENLDCFLTESDWVLINTGSSEKTFSKGDIILDYNNDNSCIYVLCSGCYSVVLHNNNTLIDFPDISEPGSIFGEIGLFHGLRSYSTITAKTVVKVSQLNRNFLFRLFDAHPKLGVKFYNFIGQQLSNFLTSADKTKYKSRKLNYSHNESSPILLSTAIQSVEEVMFYKFFPELKEEKLIMMQECIESRAVGRKKQLFITQNLIAFGSTMFGQKRKEIITLFSNDISIHPFKQVGFSISQGSTKKRILLSSTEIRDHILSLLQSLIEIGSKDSNNNKNTLSSTLEELNNTEHISTLSDDEWKIILGTQSRITYSQGDCIIKEGHSYKTLFQTISGLYQIEKQADENGLQNIIACLDSGEVLGEINFFTHKAASASVVVTSEEAEVELIDKQYLWNELLQNHSNIVLRFYYHLCYTIGQRLTKPKY